MNQAEGSISNETDIEISEALKDVSCPMLETPVASNENIASADGLTDVSDGVTLYNSARSSVAGWQDGIIAGEAEIARRAAVLANLKAADNHQLVFQALRDVVFFSAWALDNPADARDSFAEWEKHKPDRKNTNPYTQPVNLIFDIAGITPSSINVKRCEWAKIAQYVHPMIKAGELNKNRFIRYVKVQGGIQKLYKKATARSKQPSGRKPGGGNGVPTVPIGNSNQRKLVAVILDITDSKTYRSTSSVQRTFGGLKETVTCVEIDEAIFGRIQKGGE